MGRGYRSISIWNLKSLPMSRILYSMSVLSFGALFQVYVTAIPSGTKTATVLRSTTVVIVFIRKQ